MVCKMCHCFLFPFNQLVSEHEAKDDEEEKIPDDFYYNFEDHSSRPQITEESGLPSDLLTLQYPFVLYELYIFSMPWPYFLGLFVVIQGKRG